MKEFDEILEMILELNHQLKGNFIKLFINTCYHYKNYFNMKKY